MNGLTIFRSRSLYDVDQIGTQTELDCTAGWLLMVRDWEEIAEDLYKPIADTGNTIEQFAAAKDQGWPTRSRLRMP